MAKKATGRGRVDMRIEPEAADAVVLAASRCGLSFSSYIRLAVYEKLKLDGFEVGAVEPKLGRPKKAKSE